MQNRDERVQRAHLPQETKVEVPGLRQGQYLCFFGMHIFTPTVMDILAQDGPFSNLSLVLERLSKRERYLAAILPGLRFDIGSKYGLLQAQLALSLEGPDREEVLSMMLELAAR